MRPSRALSALAVVLSMGTAGGRAATQPASSPTPPKLRLPETAKPLSQAVELAIDPSRETFSGTTSIEIEIKAPTAFIWLNGRGIKVKEASARQAKTTLPARIEAGGDEFLGFAFEKPLSPGRLTLTVAYEGALDRKETLGLFAQQEGGDWYVLSQFEATAARRAFPCFDEPAYKIPWTVTLKVPKDLVALSNAPETSSTPGPDQLKTVRFAATPPLPSYLVAVAIGPFELVDAGKAGSRGTPLRIATPRGRAGEARWAAETTPKILGLLEEYFGMPYPYAKLDQVAVPLTVGFGAMENAGLVTYQQAILLRKPEEENIGFRRGFAGTCAHELAHMWFGDLVTMAWWDDLWLNESFASWMGAKVTDRFKPEWDVKVQRVSSRSGAMGQDSLATSRKIRQPIENEHDIANAFDGITYAKGEAILEMFESYLGEEPFRRGVTGYLKRHAWGNATAHDFLAALSPPDILAFSTFLDQSGVPLVTAELACGEGQPRLKLSQKPYRPIGSKDASSKTWRIPVCVRYPGGKGRQCTLLDQASTELPLETASCPAWVQPNDNGAGYYRVAYRGETLRGLLADGGRRLSIPERVSLLGDLAAAVRSGDLPAAEALAVIPGFLQDPSRHLAGATASLVNAVTGNVVPDPVRPKLAAFVRSLYGERARALGWKARPDDDEDTRLLRQTLVGLVAIAGEDPALGAEAAALAKAWLEDPKALDPDMLPIALRAGARTGDRVLFDRLRAELPRTQDRLKRQRLLGALGSFRDPAIAKESLALVLDESVDVRESLGVLFGATGDPDTRDLAFGFYKQNADAIAKRLPREAGAALSYLAAGYCDGQKRAEAEAFLRPRVEASPGGPRTLAQVLERIDLCDAYRQAQQASVVSFLEKQ
ncbi:MAG TPA: M1 family aminopeptidase [Vicinamibacteria bacterium]|nr:M1 family aminopeptidase [Vicinamibacteria bacterium]